MPTLEELAKELEVLRKKVDQIDKANLEAFKRVDKNFQICNRNIYRVSRKNGESSFLEWVSPL